MREYKKPTIESIYFDINNNIMENITDPDGYDDGDTGDNPWGGFFESDSDAGLIKNV